MQSIAFKTAFDELMILEGGYINDSLDKGGETKYGICKKSYPDLDIVNLTVDDAKIIYYRDFWNKYDYDTILDSRIAKKVFHMTVNAGAKQSHLILQRALRATGILDQTSISDTTLDSNINLIRYCNIVDSNLLSAALRSELAGFYRLVIKNNPTQEKFRNSWMKRAYDDFQ